MAVSSESPSPPPPPGHGSLERNSLNMVLSNFQKSYNWQTTYFNKAVKVAAASSFFHTQH